MQTTTEIRIHKKLLELGCAARVAAEIDGQISQSRLSRALSGQAPLNGEDGRRFLKLLDDMLDLMKESAVVPDWQKTDDVRRALNDRRAGTLFVAEIASEFGVVHA